MMTNETYPSSSNQQDHLPEAWQAAVERLDHLRARMAGNTSSFVRRQFELALEDFSKACSARQRDLAGVNHGGF